MATLLLRLAAPLQAWGADSKFETRKTNREPTKSGVLGMLAAALGIRRDQTEELEKLKSLHFGVRVEREGSLLVDFHTAKAPKKSKSYTTEFIAWIELALAKAPEENISYITYRHYLQDAVFLVGLESKDEAYLHLLEDALSHPAFPLYLGRRSCPPTLPLCLGIRESDLKEALLKEPDLCGKQEKQKRIVMDALPGERNIALQRDIPISFDPRHRQYADRAVQEFTSHENPETWITTEHDPFDEL